MGEDNRCSILDELAKCSGYDIALMTTYNFDIEFFEKTILNTFLAKELRTISIFVDAKELVNSLNEFNINNMGSHIGSKYMVNPVRMSGSFHPKVILLLGEKKARLFIASANITTSGITTNNEIFNYFDYDANHTEYLDVIVRAIDFFNDINEVSYKCDSKVLTDAKKYIYYHNTKKNEELFLLHNLKKSIISQLKELIIDDVESISIAVPYYDRELLALQQIKESFPKAHIDLFVQNRKSTFPIAYNESHNIVENINVFDGFIDNKSDKSISNKNFYHGKVFLFKTSSKSYILYGSANCTMSAFTKGYEDGGNIECDFLELGNVSEFDYFFDNMDLEIEEDFTSQEMIYEAKEPSNFLFKYGEVKEKIELHIDYKRKIDDIVVRLKDIELDFEYVNNEMVVNISEEHRDILTDIFEIQFYYNDKNEVLRCWTFNKVALLNNREYRHREEDWSDVEIDSTGDKYIKDRRRIIEAEITCYADLQEYNDKLKYKNQLKLEQEEESEEDQDYIIDYQIPDEYRYAYRQFDEVAKIRNVFYRRFLGLSFMRESDRRTHTNVGSDISKESTRVIKRKPTSDEKRFAGFVRGTVKGMMGDKYVDGIAIEHYIGLVSVIIDVFDKYLRREPVEDMFDLYYVMDTKLSFAMIIINKYIYEPIDDEKNIEQAIIRNSLGVILENYYHYYDLKDEDERSNINLFNRNVLLLLENNFSIRIDYPYYIKNALSECEWAILSIEYNDACKYIDGLFGYKTFDMLRTMINGMYPNAVVKLENKKLSITFDTNNILQYKAPNRDLIREITKYSNSVEKINIVQIVINNIAPNLNDKSVIKKKYKLMLDYRKLHSDIIRVNGSVDSESDYFRF